MVDNLAGVWDTDFNRKWERLYMFMRKKVVAWVLSMLLMLSGAFALAELPTPEEVSVDISFEGDIYPLEDFGLQMLLPMGWSYVEDDDVLFAMQNEETNQMMAAFLVPAEDHASAEDLMADVDEIDDMTGEYVTINGLPFVLYEYATQDLAGAFLITEEGEPMLHIVFGPASDAEFAGLRMQILSSIQPVSE